MSSFGILSGLLTHLSSLTHVLIPRIPRNSSGAPLGSFFLCLSLVTRDMGNWPDTLQTFPGIRDWGREVFFRGHKAWKGDIQEWKPKDTGLKLRVVSSSLGDPG